MRRWENMKIGKKRARMGDEERKRGGEEEWK
jgi:hypothetical protein